LSEPTKEKTRNEAFSEDGKVFIEKVVVAVTVVAVEVILAVSARLCFCITEQQLSPGDKRNTAGHNDGGSYIKRNSIVMYINYLLPFDKRVGC
jgi:hypothetical protein